MSDLIKLSSDTMAKLALSGDVGGLNPQEKVQYYSALCQRVGLDPATQPFKLMKLNGRETFYLDRSGAQQLNRVHQISHSITSREFVNGCYVVTARASIGDRHTDSLGAVATEGLRGEALANATMKAETKAKRRATLDLVGLGMLDETEVETIPNAVKTEAPVVHMPKQSDRYPSDPSEPALVLPGVSDLRCVVLDVKEASGINSKTNKPWQAWFVSFELADGSKIEAGTFSKSIGEMAMAGMGNRRMLLVTKPGKKPGTLEIASLEPEVLEETVV